MLTKIIAKLKKMPYDRLIVLQIVILLLVAIFGMMLRSEPFDGPRGLHRLLGMCAAVITLINGVRFSRQKRFTINQKAFLWVPFTLVVMASVSANLMGDIDAYEMLFNMMLMGGILALITSVISAKVVASAGSKAKPAK